jgi:N-methylhydantoinase A/oxoprolinase/acetone carboxylase beta subunit
MNRRAFLRRSGALLEQVGEIRVATTVATNAIIERRGACTGLITSEGVSP